MMIFANIPTADNRIAVINRSNGKIVAMWALRGAEDNFPMALDEKDRRLFIGTRSPSEVLVLDTESGKIIARAPSVGHADDMWYDPAHKRIYVSGGSGFISVIQQRELSHYRSIAQIRTLPGGRTSCFVPELNRLYLGVWGQGGRPELLQVYEVGS
jgi:DNA-binding beta-propeller fold protein YncE